MDDEQVADQAVERVIERGREMFMCLVIEEMGQSMELEQLMDTAARNGLYRVQVVG